MKKPWSGRFSEKTAAITDSFTESVSLDKRLWKYDIEGSIAHAKMLGKQGIIPRKEAESIVKGLLEIASEIESGKFRFNAALEDVHMNIEAALIGKIGESGKRLHTARSRNDQVAVDLRLYLKNETNRIAGLIRDLQKAFLKLAQDNMGIVMAGYTHLQRAQPVLLSHYLLAYVEMLQRDRERFMDCLKRIDVMPLGSCALAGTTLPTDRQFLASQLRFSEVSRNSIDAVSDRDFALEFLGCSSITAMHLSRFAEELVLWSSGEFGLIDISERFTTGSSIMPQKKNPDIAELIRGKTGAIYGNLIALLVVMKGLPLSYNRDMQEDKGPVFDTADTLGACLAVLTQMLGGLVFNAEKMRAAAGEGYSTATDIAEYLVKKGVPFREAHETTGKIVGHCIRKKKELVRLDLAELKSFSSLIDKDIYPLLDPEKSVRARSSYGGTSPSSVKRQISYYKKLLG